MPDEVWDLAVRRAEVVERLDGLREVGLRAADEAAAELAVSRRQVYVLLRRWREGEGVVSDLLPGRSSGGRGRERLQEAVEEVAQLVAARTRGATSVPSSSMLRSMDSGAMIGLVICTVKRDSPPSAGEASTILRATVSGLPMK